MVNIIERRFPKSIYFNMFHINDALSIVANVFFSTSLRFNLTNVCTQLGNHVTVIIFADELRTTMNSSLNTKDVEAKTLSGYLQLEKRQSVIFQKLKIQPLLFSEFRYQLNSPFVFVLFVSGDIVLILYFFVHVFLDMY